MKFRTIISLFLGICLLMAFATGVAEDTVTELTWESVQEEAEAIGGELTDIPTTNWVIFIPAEYRDRGLSESQISAGVVLDLDSETQHVFVKGEIQPYDPETAVETCLLKYKDAAVEKLLINGATAYRLTPVEGKIKYIVMIDMGDWNTLELIFYNVDEVSEPYVNIMLASVMNKK